MTVNILGTPYEVNVCHETTEPRLIDCDGFCDETTHEIIVENYEDIHEKPDVKRNLDVQVRKNIRHEIVHAFLCESGLCCGQAFL